MDYFNDIQIAVDSIHALKLDGIFNINDCIFDLYCVPSHDDYTYYVCIYIISGRYMAVYARTEINDIFGNTIYCDTFECASRMSNHSAKMSKIICGYLNLSEKLVHELKLLIELFPAKDCILEENQIVIDGVWQVIRLWKNGSPQCTISFENMSAKRIFGTELAEIVCSINKLIESEIRKE